MTEKRSPDSHDAFERALLGSARADRMSPDKKRALALALTGGAAAGATLVASGTAGAATKAAASAGAAKAKGALGVALLKWFAVGAVGSVVAASASVGAVRAYEGREAERTERERIERAAALASAPPKDRAPAPPVTNAGAAPGAEKANVDPPASATITESPPPEARGAREAREPKAASRAPAPTLADEVALVARARALVRDGDLTGATAVLDQHDRAHPSGALSEECEVLRVEIARATDPARAASMARAFLARHPSSPHAARVRALGGEAP